MRPRLRPAALVFGFALLLGCSAFRETDECSRDTDCARGSRCEVAAHYCRTAAPIRIGYLAPLTGAQAAVAARRLNAARFGVWLVERATEGGVLGRGLELVVRDTLGSVESVPTATRDVLDANVAAVVGPARSGEVLEARKLTLPARLVHIGPTAGATSLGDAEPDDDRFGFQLSYEASYTAAILGAVFGSDALPSAYGACFDGIAIVATDDTTGQGQAEVARRAFTDNCLPVTASILIPTDRQGSYDAEVKALRGATRGGVPTRCLFLATTPAAAGGLLRALRAAEAAGGASSRPPYDALLGGSTMNTRALFDDLRSAVDGAPSLAEGMHGIDGDSQAPRAERLDLEDLWSEYRQANVEADDGALLGGDSPYAEAIVLLALAMEAAGGVEDPVALRDALLAVARNEEGDLAVGPRDLTEAFSRIRSARREGRAPLIDYRGGFSECEFNARGFVSLPSEVWRARAGSIERVRGFTEEETLASIGAPGPGCARAR